MKIGLTLPNRRVVFGVTSCDEMLDLAEIADRSDLFSSVWVGDRLLAKPRLETHLYHDINVDDDRAVTVDESKWFLDTYYGIDFAARRVETWTAAGASEECAAHLGEFERMGLVESTLRRSAWDQHAQLRRVMDEVLSVLSVARA